MLNFPTHTLVPQQRDLAAEFAISHGVRWFRVQFLCAQCHSLLPSKPPTRIACDCFGVRRFRPFQFVWVNNPLLRVSLLTWLEYAVLRVEDECYHIHDNACLILVQISSVLSHHLYTLGLQGVM